MRNITTAMLLVLFTAIGTQAQEKDAHDRAGQVRKYFLKEANKEGSAINKALSNVKVDLETGFCAEDCVLPKKLTKENIQMIKTGSETYIGTYRGDEESDEGSDDGYESVSFEIIVLLNEVVYGGRMNSETAVRFNCNLSTDSYDSPKPSEIKCEVIPSK